jgi:O-antigen ligase
MPARGDPSGRATGATGLGASLDAGGLALLVAAVAWTFVSAAASGGAAAPVVALLVGSAAALVAGRALGSVNRVLVPALVAVTAGISMLVPGTFDRRPLAGLFGYANAAAGFFALASVAALMIACSTRGTGGRVLAVSAAIAFAVVPIARGSLAPSSLLVLGPVALLVARDGRGVRLVVAGCTVLFLLALGATAAVGAAGTGGSRGAPGVVEQALSQRRVALWHDALALMAAHPLTGVGPGRFAQESPVARSDVDATRAHQEFLQQGAEQGVLGLALLVALVLWGFARLWVTGSGDGFVALGAVALAVVSVHACVDYVLHFPAIPIAGAALVGAAQAAGSRPARRVETMVAVGEAP